MTVWIFELILVAVLTATIIYIGYMKRKHMDQISKIQRSKIVEFYKNSQNIIRLEEPEPTILDIIVRLKLLSDSLDFSYDKKTISLAINHLVSINDDKRNKN